MVKNIAGIVCSKDRKEIYCLEKSGIYNKMVEEGKDFDIIYISSYYLRDLIIKNADASKWDINEILKLEQKYSFDFKIRDGSLLSAAGIDISVIVNGEQVHFNVKNSKIPFGQPVYTGRGTINPEDNTLNLTVTQNSKPPKIYRIEGKLND